MPPAARSSENVSVVTAVAITAPKPSPSTTRAPVTAQGTGARETGAGGAGRLGLRAGRVRAWATAIRGTISRHPVARVKDGQWRDGPVFHADLAAPRDTYPRRLSAPLRGTGRRQRTSCRSTLGCTPKLGVSASFNISRLSSFFMRVLLAEDDQALRSVVERGLKEHGYVVDAVADGDAALGYLREFEYEVAIIDWRMPKVSGLDVVRTLRARRDQVPVLMLTARDAAVDRVAGLDEGADDYLVKPFDFGELLARLRALQRRPRALQPTTLVVGDVELDPATREVRAAGGRPVLTSTELAILELLMRRSPAVVHRRSIALHVWEQEADAVGSNTIDVHLARLRAKLAPAHARIETVRGVGYRVLPA